MLTFLLRFLFLALFCLAAWAEPIKLQVLSNVPSPQPVGTSIGLQSRIEKMKRIKYVFQYSASVNGGAYHVIRDFSQDSSFIWTPPLFEHQAQVRLAVKNDAGETGEAVLPFRILSRLKNSVTPTGHPLVALFSAPPCPENSQIRVAFRTAESSKASSTPWEGCRGGVGNNLYVAGMRADTAYQMRAEVLGGSKVVGGDWLSFHTGLLDGNFPLVTTTKAAAKMSDMSEPFLVHSVVNETFPRSLATDLDGNIVWYLRQNAFMTRMVKGGHFLSLSDGTNSVNDMHRLQILREFDLAGNVVRETNIGRVAEQLESRGIKSGCKKGGEECVDSFHHEAIRLTNGHTLVVAGLERMFPAGTQGAKERVDVIGDLVIDLDEDLQVKWVWNAFDYLDLKRPSLADEKCKIGPGDDGCPAVFLADTGNGWLHSNSLNYVPSDGSLLLSMPEQDWVIKVDYQNGAGSGKVLWRLGEGGDFTVKSNDPDPWFSYQHDAGFEPVGSDMLSLIDDGHARKKKHPEANNRGQVWKLDEKAKTAELVYNADLGVYSFAVGSAQKLSNGGYSFEAGLLNPGPGMFARAIETSADGKVAYTQQLDGMIVYRSFRVADLYSAPTK